MTRQSRWRDFNDFKLLRIFMTASPIFIQGRYYEVGADMGVVPESQDNLGLFCELKASYVLLGVWRADWNKRPAERLAIYLHWISWLNSARAIPVTYCKPMFVPE
jgi:hypothetical protein